MTPVYKYREAKHCTTTNQHLGLSDKRNGTQRRTKVFHDAPCMYCGMLKDTSRDEVTLNSEKIKPVALAMIELYLPNRQAVENSINFKKL